MLQEFVRSVCKKFVNRILFFGNKRSSFFNLLLFKRRKMSEIDKSSVLFPPGNVQGMTELDRRAFTKNVEICGVYIQSNHIRYVYNDLKKFLLRIPKMQAVQLCSDLNLTVQNSDDGTPLDKVILLDPNRVPTVDDFNVDKLHGVNKSQLQRIPIQLSYENYQPGEIFRAIIEDGASNCSGYSRMGHLIHLNLKEHLLPYKHLIGQVFLDKLKTVTCVVNKTTTIDNTFRNFTMEVLAGKPDFIVNVRENRCIYQMDFSKVYWNSRLAGEHERLVELFKAGDFVLDVFAGVGPFAIPAAKKHCQVLANDLNPDSFYWLKKNADLNKVKQYVEAYNVDGRQFIRTVCKDKLKKRWKDLAKTNSSVHFVMNLPASAMEFLDCFKDYLSVNEISVPVYVHIYTFTKEEEAENSLRDAVNNAMHMEPCVKNVAFVRNVAPKKYMYRVTFLLPMSSSDGQSNGPFDEVVEPETKKSSENMSFDEVVEPETKKIKIDN